MTTMNNASGYAALSLSERVHTALDLAMNAASMPRLNTRLCRRVKVACGQKPTQVQTSRDYGEP
jgi:hypothetical protein